MNDPVAGPSLPKISAEMIERIIQADALGELGSSMLAPATGFLADERRLERRYLVGSDRA